MSNPEAINYARAGTEQKKQATPPPATPPPAMPSSATFHEPMEVIGEEVVVPRHSTPIENVTQEGGRLPSQPQAPVQGAVSGRERIASVNSPGEETPRTSKKRSVSEGATPREVSPPSGAAHNAVPVSKRISQLQVQLMGGEGGGEGDEESIPSPVPAQGAAGGQEMVTSGEVQVASEEGTKSVKVVDIQHRPADFGLDSFVEWEGQEEGSSSEDEGVGASPPHPPVDPSAERQESKTSTELGRSRSKGFSASRSISSQLGTPEGSLNASMLSTLHSRKKGQRHLYRSVKLLAPVSLFTEVERKEKKEALTRLYEAQTIQRQMGLLERQYDDLEETGKQLELALRADSTGEGWSPWGRGQAMHWSPWGRGQATHWSPWGRGQAMHWSPWGRGQATHCSPRGGGGVRLLTGPLGGGVRLRTGLLGGGVRLLTGPLGGGVRLLTGSLGGGVRLCTGPLG